VLRPYESTSKASERSVGPLLSSSLHLVRRRRSLETRWFGPRRKGRQLLLESIPEDEALFQVKPEHEGVRPGSQAKDEDAHLERTEGHIVHTERPGPSALSPFRGSQHDPMNSPINQEEGCPLEENHFGFLPSPEDDVAESRHDWLLLLLSVVIALLAVVYFIFIK